MSVSDESDEDAVIDECIDELDDLVMSLDRYPPAAVAVAIGTYLEGLLGALLDEHQCTAEEVRALLREIESGVLQPQGPATNAPAVSRNAPGPCGLPQCGASRWSRRSLPVTAVSPVFT